MYMCRVVYNSSESELVVQNQDIAIGQNLGKYGLGGRALGFN